MRNHIILFLTLIILLSCNSYKKEENQRFNKTETHTNAGNKLSKEKPVIDKAERETKIATEVTIIQSQQQFIQNKDTKIGVIDDSDDFTNLRLEPNTVSTILKKIKVNEYFFFNKTQSLDWFKVKDLYGFVGYLHKSRVQLVVNDKLFNVSFVNYFEKQEKKKDTIVLLKDLDVFFETYYEESNFNYNKIELKTANNSLALFSNENTEIKISKVEFDTDNHKLEYYKDHKKHVEKIDGMKFWGADGGIPRFEISEIEIIQDQESFFIPKNEIKDIFEPNFELVNVYKTKDKRIIISMMNSDGAGAYCVIFIVKDKQLQKRIVYVPF